ncbi:MAG: N-acetylmuramoyl-L-alanine amidase [Deltaproteobacteria bacterium]|nr:N-acetylmuramoyl-L-alanine amidase [Deltaproteobacteria bacterium]
MMLGKCQKYTMVLFSVLFMCFPGLLLHAQTVKHVVVIDPAHGGEDAGVVGIDKIAEKDLTLAIAQALKKELAQNANLEVVLTRDSDITVSLAERRKNIRKIQPAIVLSLHINAGFGKTSSGFEMYYPGFHEENDSPKKKTGKDDANDEKYLSDTVRLSRLVQKGLDGLFPRKGRGLREADVPLAEDLALPVLTVELGFATNPEEKKKLASGRTQKDIARALAKSINSFF